MNNVMIGAAHSRKRINEILNLITIILKKERRVFCAQQHCARVDGGRARDGYTRDVQLSTAKNDVHRLTFARKCHKLTRL